MSSPARTPPIMRSPPPPEAAKENAIVRLFITPLTFISFLLSLALIDTHNHSLRTDSHSPRPPPSTILGQITQFIHSLIFKSVPGSGNQSRSPYAYIRSPNADTETEKERGLGEKGRGKEEEPWHWHTKQRHLMKAEMEDAFRVRKWVVVFMAVFGLGVVVAGSAVVRLCFIWREWSDWS